MSTDFVIDFETLDSRATAVILSFAILAVDFEEDFTMDKLREQTMFVKLNAKTQGNRTISQSTLDWWKMQDADVRKSQMLPSPNDVELLPALHQLHEFLDRHGYSPKKSVVWSRGTLDQIVYEDWSKTLGFDPPKIPYWNHRDVRTAIDILSGSSNGYCTTSRPMGIINKHDPVDDVCMDAFQLKYFIEQ